MCQMPGELGEKYHAAKDCPELICFTGLPCRFPPVDWEKSRLWKNRRYTVASRFWRKQQEAFRNFKRLKYMRNKLFSDSETINQEMIDLGITLRMK